MAARKEFDIALKYGEAVEGSVAALLKSTSYEVKADVASNRTGNFCIEYRQRAANGELVPSGIAVTTAEWYVLYWDRCVYLFVPTALVKTLARKYRAMGRLKRTGDNGNISILIPVEEFYPTGPRLVK